MFLQNILIMDVVEALVTQNQEIANCIKSELWRP